MTDFKPINMLPVHAASLPLKALLILFVTVSLCQMNNITTTTNGRLQVLPLWNGNTMSAQCNMTELTPNEFRIQGSGSGNCSLLVNATSAIMLTILDRSTTMTDYLFMEDNGKSIGCPNQYAVLNLTSSPCSATFNQNIMQLHFHGSLILGVKSVPYYTQEHSRNCVELRPIRNVTNCNAHTLKDMTRLYCSKYVSSSFLNHCCSNALGQSGTEELNFQYPINLTILDLSENELTSLEEGIFTCLINLNTLDLSWNKLRYLEAGTFRDLINLKTLDMSRNKLKSLEAGTFRDLINLNTLYLHGNELRSMEAGTFIGLRYLETLYLSHNYLESLQNGSFIGLIKLNTLQLYRNTLSSIGAGTFTGLGNLETLDLFGNNLESLQNESFAGLIKLKSLDLRGNNLEESLQNGSFPGLINLNTLNLSENKLIFLKAGTFAGLSNLKTLDLTGNKLKSLEAGTFTGLSNLKSLDLRYMEFTSLQAGTFTGLSNLKALDLSYNQFTSLEAGTFTDLINLETLYLNGNYKLRTLKEGTFRDLRNLKTLELRFSVKLRTKEAVFVDLPLQVNIHTYKEYCDCVLKNKTKYNCTFEERISPYSSCRLLAHVSVTAFMFIFGITAVVGNIFVLFWRGLHREEEGKVQSILLSNLATSDLLMGIYMVAIASADVYFDENYLSNSLTWRCNPICVIIGILAFISSEASVFFITLISIDRFINIRFPYTTHKLRVKSTKITVGIMWFLSFFLAIVAYIAPYVNCQVWGLVLESSDFYAIQDLCISLPLSQKLSRSTGMKESSGFYYSIAVFLGLNLLCFLVILGCYLEIIRAVTTSSSRAGRSLNMQKQIRLTKKVAAIVATDFFCWFPIIITAILVQSGVTEIDEKVYPVFTTFILPINSTINPFLYTIAHQINKHRKQKNDRRQKAKNVALQCRPRVRDAEDLADNHGLLCQS